MLLIKRRVLSSSLNLILDVSAEPLPNESCVEKSDDPLKINQESSIANSHSKDMAKSPNQTTINSRDEYYLQESQSLFSDNSQNTLSESREAFSQSIEPSGGHTTQELSTQEDVFDSISNSDQTSSVFKDVSDTAIKLGDTVGQPSIDSKKQDIEHGGNRTPPENDKISSVASISETEGDDNAHDSMLVKSPSMKVSLVKRTFATKEEETKYKAIVDRCVRAFALCLKRFPEHYKSQYKIAFVATYFETHRVRFFMKFYGIVLI